MLTREDFYRNARTCGQYMEPMGLVLKFKAHGLRHMAHMTPDIYIRIYIYM